MRHRYVGTIVLLLLLPSLGCTQKAQQTGPVAHLSGTVTVNSAIDSTADYSGIEVIVTDAFEDGPDTLGYAMTDREGHFETVVEAYERGVYPLILKRRDAVLSISELVVVEGDSITVKAELPLAQRLPAIRSRENSAWTAFKNAEVQHQSRISNLLQEGANRQQIRNTVLLGSEVLWSIRSSFPETMASRVASVKSVVMLEGWHDSLLVARLTELEPSSSGFTDAVVAAARAKSRLEDIDAAVTFLEEMQQRVVTDARKALLQVEIVKAYIDSRRREEALDAIQILETRYSETSASEWAERARYEVENLWPGSEAPTFSLRARAGGRVELQDLEGEVVVLEFWSPRDRSFAASLPEVEQLVRAGEGNITWLSVALEGDQDFYEAFFEGRRVPGRQLRDAPSVTQDLIEKYNVETVPTRYLIDREGRIVGKYVGTDLEELRADMIELLSLE